MFLFNLFALTAVYLGVQHFTHHHCIAVAAVAGLLFLKNVNE
jgi:hypothetical protein